MDACHFGVAVFEQVVEPTTIRMSAWSWATCLHRAKGCYFSTKVRCPGCLRGTAAAAGGAAEKGRAKETGAESPYRNRPCGSSVPPDENGVGRHTIRYGCMPDGRCHRFTRPSGCGCRDAAQQAAGFEA